MKHIFLIHSHITREVAWAVIRHEHIALSDVVFVLDRKFETKESGIRVVPLDLPDEYFLIYKNPFRGWCHLRRIWQFIDDLSPGDFRCYFPHTYSELADLVMSHSRCRGYGLMEEGLWSYFPAKMMNEVVPPAILGWRQRLLSRIFYMGRFKDRFFCKDDYLSVYGTSEKAFPDFARKIVVELAFPGAVDEARHLPVSVRKVIVLDSVVETKVVTEGDFMAGFDQLVEKLTERLGEGEIVYLKRHPYQYVKPEFSDRLIAHLKRKVHAHEVRELASEVSLEKMALTDRVEFYLNVSSVSVYASRLGSKVYSYARSIGRSSPEFMRHVDRLPQVFHESVEFI